MAIPYLNAADRRTVLDAVLRTIDTKFMGPDADTGTLRATHGPAVVNAESVADFEAAVNAVLRELGVSHTGFFHESAPRTAGRVALAATFTKATTPDGERWMFQDVHPGGAAAAAGIRPGDVLLSVAGRELTPPTATPFTLGERYEVVLRRPDGSTASPTLAVPHPKDKRQPVVVPDQVVTASKLDGGIGLGDGDRTVIIAGSAADATAQASAQVMNRFLNRAVLRLQLFVVSLGALCDQHGLSEIRGIDHRDLCVRRRCDQPEGDDDS